MKTRSPLRLGCIADDLTGGTDLANEFAQHGVKVIQVVGVPTRDLRDLKGEDDFQVVVVALKTRTAPVEQAVAQTADALDWLIGNGATTSTSSTAPPLTPQRRATSGRSSRLP